MNSLTLHPASAAVRTSSSRDLSQSRKMQTIVEMAFNSSASAGATTSKGSLRHASTQARISMIFSRCAVWRPARKTYNSGPAAKMSMRYSPRDKPSLTVAPRLIAASSAGKPSAGGRFRPGTNVSSTTATRL